jgi:hypothetical protein
LLQAKVGLSNVSGEVKDGVLSCTLHRQLMVAGGANVFNLTGHRYHILLARGNAKGKD